MRPEDSLNAVEQLRKEKLENLKKCFSELEGYKHNKLKLQYPVFFVPGWTGENCDAWKKNYDGIPKEYQEYYHTAQFWIEEIVENKQLANFIDFTEAETSTSPSFMELGACLGKKILAINKSEPVNLVGHSMGGLDIRSAVINDDFPSLNVKNILTVGTPNNGTPEANLMHYEFVQRIAKNFKKMKTYHILQCCSMGSKSEAIKKINTKENRLKMFDRIEKFYVFMGLRDSTVKGSPKLDKKDIPEGLYENKVITIQTSSAEHTGKDGITQDPRIFLPLIRALCGIELKDDLNHGYFRHGYMCNS